MIIYAHRGNWDLYPENSRSAITWALENGFGVEIDIRFTLDGKIIIVHDENLRRLFGVDKNVKDLNARDLSGLSFLPRMNEHPLILDDLASLFCRDKYRERIPRVAVHFKQSDQNSENCEQVADLFRRYDLYESLLIFNLSLDSCRWFRRIDSKIKLAVIVSDYQFEPFVYLWDEVKVEPSLFDVVWAAEYRNLYGKSFFNEVHELGLETIVVSPELHKDLGHPKANSIFWEYWPDFCDYGVEGICTDYPAKLSKFLFQHQEGFGIDERHI